MSWHKGFFAICSEIPSKEERLSIYSTLKQDYSEFSMEVVNGGIWSYGDIFICNDIDVMPMYFTVEEMETYLRETLEGKHLEKEGRFYPVERLASIETINVLYEEDLAWTKLKKMLMPHPEAFFKAWYRSQSW